LGKSTAYTSVAGATPAAYASTDASTYPAALFVPIFVHACAFAGDVPFGVASTDARGYGPISGQGDSSDVGATVNMVLIIPIVVGCLDQFGLSSYAPTAFTWPITWSMNYASGSRIGCEPIGSGAITLSFADVAESIPLFPP
jgi:hypothetical protein